MAVAANNRAEAEFAWTLAQPPQLNLVPTLTMSLEQPLTVEVPAKEDTPRAATLPVTLEQSGENAAELTPNAVLFDPIGGLTIDTDTATLVPSPTRRASVSAAFPTTEISPRSRHEAALH